MRTKRFAEMMAFLEEVVGYRRKRFEPGFAAYITSTGQRFELFDESYTGKRHFTTGPVPGFEVANFDAAVRWLDEAGVEILEPPVTSESGTRWVHFRGPDDNVYEFVYHPDLNE